MLFGNWKKKGGVRKKQDYRPIPFWSWNDDLKIDELVRQIDVMKENGILLPYMFQGSESVRAV